MPYRRRRYKRRPRATAWYNKRHSAMSLAVKTAKYVKKYLNVERKLFDTTVSATVSSTGNITHLSAVPLGDTQNSRDGVSVKATGLFIRAEYTEHASVVGATFLRCMIIRDNRQVASSTPAIATILQTVSRNSFLNEDTLGRFNVLSDRIHTLSNVGTVGKHFEVNLPMNSHLRWNADLGSNIESNGLYIVLISNQGTNVPLVGFEARLRYVDN